MERSSPQGRSVWQVGFILFWLGVVAFPGPGFADEDDEEEIQTLRERLTEREDENRTEDPLVVDFMGRPLSMSAQYEAVFDYIDRIPVGGSTRSYGQLLFEQELEGEAFYSISPSLSFFIQLRFAMEEDLLSETPDDASDTFVERGEMWLNWTEILGMPLSIEGGRLDFEDDRLWWWDEDLDAVRLIYETDTFEIALAAAEELAPARTDRDYIEPEFEDVPRVISEISLDWNDNHAFQFFTLHQKDRSETEQPGSIIRSEREDESDAELTWMGARAAGAFDLGDAGLLGYWADVARVRGRETLIETEDVPPVVDGTSRYVEVDEVLRQDVRGWAFDMGVTWALPIDAEPRFTLAWAKGSGDHKPDNGTDTSFHQTGIHANECAFGGVERFQVYGEVLDPELSNISIVTAGIGWSLMEASSLDLVFHDYRLVEKTEELRDSRLDAELTGVHRDLGEGVDLILGLEEWEAVQFRFTASAFRTGEAFGIDRDQWIYGSLAEFRFAF